MLHSQAVASILRNDSEQFIVYVRQDFEENLGFYSFIEIRKRFPTYAAALIWYNKAYPQGKIVPFAQLTVA